MKSIVRTLILSFLIICTVWSLDARVSSDPPVEDSIVHLIAKGKELYKKNLFDAIEVMDSALTLSHEYELDSLEAQSKYYLSLYLFMSGDNERSVRLINEILPFYSRGDKPRSNAILLSRLGRIYMLRSEYDDAKKYLNEAYRLLQQIENPSQVSLGFNRLWMSDLQILVSEFEEGISQAQGAYEHFKKANDLDKMIAAKANIAEVLILIKNYREADAILDEILVYQDSVDNQQFVIKPLNLKGIAEYEMGNSDESERVLQRSIDLANRLGSFPKMSRTYLYLSKVRMQQGRLSQALELVDQAISEAQKSQVKKSEMQAKLHKSIICLALNKKTDTKELVQAAMDWADKVRDLEVLQEGAGIMADLLSQTGNFALAYEYRTIERNAAAEFLSVQKIKDISIKQTMHDIEEAQQQKEIQQKLLQIDYEHQIESAKMTSKYLIFGLLGLFIMMGFLLRSNYVSRKANEKLEIKNKELVAAENTLAEKNSELKRYIESNIQLQQFAHIASHDLKSPIRTISSFIGLVKATAQDRLSDKEKDYINRALKASKEMFGLIEDLLSYSKVNALSLQVEPVKTKELVETVLGHLNQNIVESKAVINVELEVDEIEADSIKLRQVFQNLIANAIKFMPDDRTPMINISGKESLENYVFQIEDNGIGIDDEYKEKVFEPFKQLNKKEEYAGTGLGLSLCKRIIQKHQGKIWVESELGKGTKFTFTISKFLS